MPGTSLYKQGEEESRRTNKVGSKKEVVDYAPLHRGIYCINTNYIVNTVPGELSRENMISSHVKITCYLHMRKDHRCYGYIINRAFCSKKIFK